MDEDSQYVFIVRITQVIKWRTLLEVILPLATGNMTFSKEGLEIHGTTYVMNIFVKLSNFDYYIFNGKKYDLDEVPLGVEFRILWSASQTLKDGDIVALKWKSPSSNSIEYEIISEGVRSVFNIHTLDCASTVNYICPSKYDCILQVESSRLHSVIRAHRDHGEKTQILALYDSKTENYSLFFHTEGLSSTATTCIGAKKESMPIHEESMSLSCDKSDKYSIRALLLILKASNLSPYVTLKLIDDYPLLLTWQVGDMGFVQFALAAMVVEDQEKSFSLSDFDIEKYKLFYKDKKEKSSYKEEKKETQVKMKTKIRRKKNIIGIGEPPKKKRLLKE
jgi:hypothetical protein